MLKNTANILEHYVVNDSFLLDRDRARQRDIINHNTPGKCSFLNSDHYHTHTYAHIHTPVESEWHVVYNVYVIGKYAFRKLAICISPISILVAPKLNITYKHTYITLVSANIFRAVHTHGIKGCSFGNGSTTNRGVYDVSNCYLTEKSTLNPSN